MTEAEIRAELQAILKEAQDRAELLGAVLELLDAERTQGDVHTRGGTDFRSPFPGLEIPTGNPAQSWERSP